MTEVARPRRKPIPDHVKVQVLLKMLGLAGKSIDWSHEPALELRAIRADGKDFDPPQHDPKFIFARTSEDHDKLTFVDNGTGRSDLGAIAHVKRTILKQAEHNARLTAKAAGEKHEPRRSRMQSRPFPKEHRPMQSRNTLRRKR